MSPADRARLELAKRAYRAVEPRDVEVQRGVRKLRLALRRPRPRRFWLSQTLIGVVLAMGGLAYANPRALGELVSQALRSLPATPQQARASGAAAPAATSPPPSKPNPREHRPSATLGSPPAPALFSAAPVLSEALNLPPNVVPNAPRREPVSPAVAQSAGSSSASSAGARSAGLGADSGPTASNRPAADALQPGASDWGRVGAALARGDEGRALSVLEELSESADTRTRDKADLGRAQLLMSMGDRDRACSMARSLTHRRAGGRIERQAQAMLERCARDER